jgi:hypothetical protein
MFRTPALLLSLLAGIANAAPPSAKPPATEVRLLDLAPGANSHQRQTTRLTATMDMEAMPRPEASDEERAQAKARLAAAKFPMSMRHTSVSTLKTGQADEAGWLPLQLTVQALEMSATNAAGENTPMPAPRAANLSLEARFNPRDFGFEVVSVAGLGGSAAGTELASVTLKNLFSAVKGLSGQTARLGQTLTMPMDIPMQMPVATPGSGQMQGTARYTLTRLQAGVAHFDVGVDMKLDASFAAPPSAASAAASAPAGNASMRVSGAGEGQMVVRLADQLVLRQTLRMKQQMQVTLPTGDGFLMRMDMDMDATGENLAAAKPKARAKP